MALRTLTVEEFTEALAARSPVPGGGAVAAVTLAHAAALAAMVLEFTIGKPRHAAHDAGHRDALARLAELRRHALALADRDAAAYGALNAMWKLPTGHADRVGGWDRAVAEAIDAPQAILEAAAALAGHCRALAGTTNPNLASDLAIALDLARTAARAAAHNVAVNLPSVADVTDRATRQERMDRALAEAGIGHGAT
jgi:formiminotetrahydrofolate cyclodeaminase